MEFFKSVKSAVLIAVLSVAVVAAIFLSLLFGKALFFQLNHPILGGEDGGNFVAIRYYRAPFQPSLGGQDLSIEYLFHTGKIKVLVWVSATNIVLFIDTLSPAHCFFACIPAKAEARALPTASLPP